MKKEKTVRTYQRRTKSGKMITVHEHKASYDAAEEARKAAAKKAGAGSELSKKKATMEESPLGFSADDYKEWYHWDMENDANNEAALRVEKALIKKMGKKAYNKYLEDMSNSYSARGHKKAHQALLDEHTASQKKQDDKSKVSAKDIVRDTKDSSKSSTTKKKETKGDRAVSRMHKLVNEALSSTTSDPKALKKQLGALIDYNGGPMNYGDKIGKRIDEIREQLGKRSSKKRVNKKSDYDYETSMKNLENYFAEERRKITSKRKKDTKVDKEVKSSDKPSNKYGGLTKAEYEKRQKDFNKRVKDADKGTRAKYSFTDIKKKIKSADISEAARKRLLKSIEKPYAVVTPTTMEKRLQKELDKKKKPSTKTSGGAPTSADLRKQADEMDAKAYKETSKETHKKLIAKGYKKHTYQGTTYYHKGKEGSYGGSYVMLDKNGKQQTVPGYIKEGMKAQIARSVGKTYKPRTLR